LRVNHVWRRFVAHALWNTFAAYEGTEAVETWIGDLLLDLYTPETVQSEGNVSYANLAYILASGEPGGTNVNNHWTAFPVNTVIADDDDIVTLSNNQFAINAGEFDFVIELGLRLVGGCRVGLYNVTQAIPVKVGSNKHMDNPIVAGHGISNGTDYYEVQYYALTLNAGDGLGRNISSGDDEQYCDINIWLTPAV
jgi:hypothetical protein